jgi:hypothetical protein
MDSYGERQRAGTVRGMAAKIEIADLPAAPCLALLVDNGEVITTATKY